MVRARSLKTGIPMPQTRFFLTAQRAEAERIFSLLERAFEEDGWPISVLEVDEDRDIQDVSLYIEDSEVEEAGKRIAAALGFGLFGLELRREPVPDIDWVTHSLEGLAQVRAGRFLVHGSHDMPQAGGGRIPILIDAGLAFGTGHHGTTAGCLEMISEVVRNEKPRNALDVGTGTAVLAIAIAKLAPIPVLATDIDPVAVDVARDNVRSNGAAARVRCQTAAGMLHSSILQRAPFDLIVANILARPLMELAPKLAAQLGSGGSVILSGILASQRQRVLAAYRQQALFHVKTLWRGGWVTLHLRGGKA
jgi:ribosomal protein L11 methyltransferase